MSHPTRVRGLKSELSDLHKQVKKVAPHPGAWIEIKCRSNQEKWKRVAPHPGAWIEMQRKRRFVRTGRGSHPTRVRGLKYVNKKR